MPQDIEVIMDDLGNPIGTEVLGLCLELLDTELDERLERISNMGVPEDLLNNVCVRLTLAYCQTHPQLMSGGDAFGNAVQSAFLAGVLARQRALDVDAQMRALGFE